MGTETEVRGASPVASGRIPSGTPTATRTAPPHRFDAKGHIDHVHRNVERLDAVTDGVGEGGERPDGAGLADPVTPSGSFGGGSPCRPGRPRGRPRRGAARGSGEFRPEVAVLVVLGALQQRLADALADAADDPVLDELGVDPGPDVVDRDRPLEGDLAGLGVDRTIPTTTAGGTDPTVPAERVGTIPSPPAPPCPRPAADRTVMTTPLET